MQLFINSGYQRELIMDWLLIIVDLMSSPLVIGNGIDLNNGNNRDTGFNRLWHYTSAI